MTRQVAKKAIYTQMRLKASVWIRRMWLNWLYSIYFLKNRRYNRKKGLKRNDFWHLKPSLFVENISDIKYPRLANKKIVVVILRQLNHSWVVTLRENYPNTKFFLVRNFPDSNWIRRDTERYSVSLRIQFECGKTQARKNSTFRYFSRSVSFLQSWRSKIDGKWLGIL